MASVFPIREAAVAIFKETGGWLFPKWMQIITEYIKMSKSHVPTDTFCCGLNPKVCGIQGINDSEPILLAKKEKS